MFEAQPSKRLDCLTSAHHIIALLHDPVFVVTLPFDQNRIPRYITDPILFRTQQRWQWFIEARRNNPALGTLGYLPAEVRSLTWQHLLRCEDTLSMDGLWEYNHHFGPPFQLSAYYFGFGRRGEFFASAENLRLVSSQVKGEYEHSFLHMRSFRFNDSTNWVELATRIGHTYLQQLCAIELGVCIQSPTAVEQWLGSIPYLPENLRSIDIKIFPTYSNWHICPHSHDSSERLGKLVRGVSKKLPKVRISITCASNQELEPQCLAFVKKLLAELHKQDVDK